MMWLKITLHGVVTFIPEHRAVSIHEIDQGWMLVVNADRRGVDHEKVFADTIERVSWDRLE